MPTAAKIARVRVLLVEAADLIDELRGGRPAHQFRRWITWWEKLAASRTSWRYRRSRRDGITLVNATAYPTTEIGELARFVFADRAKPKRIEVRYYAKSQGDVYGLTSPAGGTVRVSLVLGWPSEHHYPEVEGAPTYTTYDWREELLATLAHEAVHVDDPSASELAAERHAVRELRRYRLEHPLRAVWVRLRPW